MRFSVYAVHRDKSLVLNPRVDTTNLRPQGRKYGTHARAVRWPAECWDVDRVPGRQVPSARSGHSRMADETKL